MRLTLTIILASCFTVGCWDWDRLVCDVQTRSLDCGRTCQPQSFATIAGCFQDASGNRFYTLTRDGDNLIVSEDSPSCGGSKVYSTFVKAFPSGVGTRCDTSQAVNFSAVLSART